MHRLLTVLVVLLLLCTGMLEGLLVCGYRTWTLSAWRTALLSASCFAGAFYLALQA